MDLMRKLEKVGLGGKAVLSILFVIILAGSAVYARGYIQSCTAGKVSKNQVIKPAPPVQNVVQEQQPPKQAEPFRKIYTVESGDSFFEILKANGVSSQEALSIIKQTRPVFNVSKIKPGNDIQFIYLDEGLNLVLISYDISDIERLVIKISDDRIAAKRVSADEEEQIIASTDSAPTPQDRSLTQELQAGGSDRDQGGGQPVQEKKQANDVPGSKQTDIKIRKGHSLSDILTELGVSRTEISVLIKTVKGVYNLATIKPGKTLSVWLAQDEPARIKRLTYEISDTKYLDVTSVHDTFKARTRTLEREVRYEAAQGKIKSSLFQSAVAAGVSPGIVIDLTDIFAHNINFFSGVQTGDSYAVLYEKFYVKDKFKGYGRVMAARFINQGKEHVAIYYENDRRGIQGYFDEKGRPLKKMFLKAPLSYRRISSSYSFNRLHPILGIVRPHLGVDYAAPTGTPVCSLGQGRVTFKGRDKGFGQTVRVRHLDGYVTHYGHLSRFAKGLKVGERVDQGDTIGYVGATGLATGPHLDFRVSHYGKFINPVKMKNVTGPPLRGSVLANFKHVSTLRIAMLENKNRSIAQASPPERKRDHEARFNSGG